MDNQDQEHTSAHQADDDAERDVSNAPPETFKKWVKEYRKIDKEIRTAAPLLGQLRKRKKQLEEVIRPWMERNEVATVQLGETETLERMAKTYKTPVNANYIGQVLEQHYKDDTQAASIVALIYGSRPESEREILKIVSSEPKKRKVRKVEGGRVADA